MKIKLIALDVDGTIRETGKPISNRTMKAISLLKGSGVIVAIATGRMAPSAINVWHELGIQSPLICHQGALILDPSTKKILKHTPLSYASAIQALEILDDCEIDCMANYDGNVYVNKKSDWFESYCERNNVDLIESPLKLLAQKNLTRIVAISAEHKIKSLQKIMSKTLGATTYVTRSLPHFCEVLAPNAGKESALQWICDQNHINPNETIAFGNGYNDIKMLEWAGIGIAVGDAVVEALEVADRVAPSLEDDGVAQVIEDLMNSGQLEL